MMEDQGSDCPCKKQRVSDAEEDSTGSEAKREGSDTEDDNETPNSELLPNLESDSEDNGISMCRGGLLDCLTEAANIKASPCIDSDTGEIAYKPDAILAENKPERKPYPSQRVRHDIASVVQDTMAALAENTYIRNKEAGMLAINYSSSLPRFERTNSYTNDANTRDVTKDIQGDNSVESNLDSNYASNDSGAEFYKRLDQSKDKGSHTRSNKTIDGITQLPYNVDAKTDLLKDSVKAGTSHEPAEYHTDDTNVIDDCDNYYDDEDDDDDDDEDLYPDKRDFLSDSGFINLFTNCRNPSTSNASQTDQGTRHSASLPNLNMDKNSGVSGMNAAGDAGVIQHSASSSSSESSPFGELKIKSLFLDSFFKYIPCGVAGKHEEACRPSNTQFRLDIDHVHKVVSQNNINSLPPQLLVHIFRYLSPYMLLRKVSLVCKYWYNWCRDQDLWKTINLMNQHRLTDVHLQQLVSFSDRVVSVNLTDCRFVTNVGVKMLLTRCVHLQMLKLMRCFDLSDEAFKDICERKLCSQLRCLRLDGCCKLTDATIVKVAKACPLLQILHINQCTKVTDLSIKVLADQCPRLTQLLMDHCSQVTEKGLEAIVEGCPYMTYLNIMSCGVTDRGVKLLSKLTNLTNVDLSNIPRLTPDAIMYLSRHCKNLECINISLNSVMNDQCVTELARNLPKLKRLYCVSCNISDAGLEKIAEYRPTLEALDVGWCQDITDHGVCVISHACPHLDYFGLIRCDQVSIEKVEELVLRFPRVNYSTFVLESRRLLERAQREGFMFGLGAENS